MRSLICASVTALAVGTFAHADFVDAVFTGTGKGSTIKIVSPGYNGDVFAGQLHFTLSNSTGTDLNGNWTAYCTDLFQYVSSGSQQYQVLPVSALPLSGPMGAAKALAIGNIYAFAAGNQLSSGTSNAYAAAFQIAIWEIVTDFTGIGGNLGLDIDAGLFQATKTDGSPFSPTLLGYLSDFFGSIGSGNSSNLIGIGSSDYQDQILELSNVIPGPGALATVAFSILFSGRRRRSA